MTAKNYLENPDLIHGGAIDEMAQLFPDAPRPWVDLSTGVNPWPYPVSHLRPECFAKLPTKKDQQVCATTMADAWGADANHIAVTPGTELIIRLLPSILNGARVCVPKPTYGDHLSSWRSAGRDVLETNDPISNSQDAEIVVLCNPNNPDGRVWCPDAVEEKRKSQARRNRWLIVDEAYCDLVPENSVVPHAGKPGLIILRSFGKFYGVPGIRLGAILAPKSILEAISTFLGHWAVSGPALALGASAYRDRNWRKQTLTRLANESQRLDAGLTKAGINITGGTDLFRFIQLPDAYSAWEYLAERGIYTRRFDYSKTELRLGLASDDTEVDRVLKAVTDLMRHE